MTKVVNSSVRTAKSRSIPCEHRQPTQPEASARQATRPSDSSVSSTAGRSNADFHEEVERGRLLGCWRRWFDVAAGCTSSVLRYEGFICRRPCLLMRAAPSMTAGHDGEVRLPLECNGRIRNGNEQTGIVANDLVHPADTIRTHNECMQPDSGVELRQLEQVR
jgi:hypothetical protein